ncbi:hypothetical protein Fmac_008422 [Flemingia macrophylla]|uniref:Uncharacterized protein n=1 Tax=Flemingia macrophylla TaxID=520843 RepID=A0ABD1MXB8_9FABA
MQKRKSALFKTSTYLFREGQCFSEAFLPNKYDKRINIPTLSSKSDIEDINGRKHA